MKSFKGLTLGPFIFLLRQNSYMWTKRNVNWSTDHPLIEGKQLLHSGHDLDREDCGISFISVCLLFTLYSIMNQKTVSKSDVSGLSVCVFERERVMKFFDVLILCRVPVCLQLQQSNKIIYACFHNSAKLLPTCFHLTLFNLTMAKSFPSRFLRLSLRCQMMYVQYMRAGRYDVLDQCSI